ncbi:MAG TPA: 30S ribosomal protein S9 [Candidatus Nitrosotalea sp.]|nr:30S ribosomal protein S9 [Candidatus Nitrosotalea sp.]
MVKLESYYASRKTARAHAYITKGVGRVRINNIPVEMVQQEVAREIMLGPLEIAGELRNKVDLSVKVKGGGFVGQSYASAIAMSRAMTGWTKTRKEPKDHPLTRTVREDLRRRLSEYDKHLLSGDDRRKEPKKFGGPGARRRKQKSYR